LSGLDEQKSSRWLWVFAAVTALVLHAGGAALAIAHLQTEALSDDAVGASAIEVGLELASANREDVNLPPGPDSEAAIASPPLPDQQAEVKDADLPQDNPTNVDDADRAVTPNKTEKPVEEDTKLAAVQTQASPESAAQEATASPNLEGRREDTAKAPKLGIGKSVELAKVAWEKKVVAHFKKFLMFPDGAKVKGAALKLALEFDRTGHVVSATIAEGSGLSAYDEAALKMVRRADPVPAPPPLVADLGLTRTLPVTFRDAK
jgi:periplasmic protein TonB